MNGLDAQVVHLQGLGDDDHFREWLSGAPEMDLAGLAKRLIEDGDLGGIPTQWEDEILCTALADGLLRLDPQDASTVLRRRGLPDPQDSSLVPEPVQWTLRGLLSCDPELTLSLDSPVMHVFLVKDGEMTSQVLVVGRGCGEARRRVYDLAFLAALSVPRPDQEVPVAELERLEAEARRLEGEGDSERSKLLDRLVKLLQDHEPAEVLDGLVWLSRSAVSPETGVPLPVEGKLKLIDDAFTLLVQELKRLAASSALVKLHQLDEAQLKPYHLPEGDARLVFEDGDDAGRIPLAAVGRPVWSEFSPIEFVLPGRVFSCQRFRTVERYFLRSLAERVRADARDRLMFYERMRERHERQSNEYEAMSPAEKDRLHREEIRYDETVDFEIGTTVKLREPEFGTGLRHYTEVLPSLLESSHRWATLMKGILDRIELAERDGRLQRLAVGYLVDRALRNLAPLAGDTEWPGLDEWQYWTRPLLLRAWRDRLEEAGGGPAASYATRRLFFRSVLHRSAEDGPPGPREAQRPARDIRDYRCILRPHYLFVNKTSALNLNGPVQRLLDRIDHLSTSEDQITTEEEREAIERLGRAIEADSELVSPEHRSEDVCRSLRDAPIAAAGRLVRSLLERNQKPLPGPGSPDPYVARIILDNVLSYYYVGAFHAATGLLIQYFDDVTDPESDASYRMAENRLPELLLHLCYLAALAYNPTAKTPAWDLVRRWYDERNQDVMGQIDRVRQALLLADEWEPAYVQRCLDLGAGKERILTSEAYRKANKARATDGSVGSLLCRARVAIEAALGLSRAREFPAGRSSARGMYRHLGDSLALVMACPDGAAVDSELQELSSLLLGAEHIFDRKDHSQGYWGGVL